MQTAALIKCKCKHDYQDQVYGHNVRLHNLCTGGRNPNNKGWRCTICLDKKDYQQGLKDDERKPTLEDSKRAWSKR